MISTTLLHASMAAYWKTRSTDKTVRRDSPSLLDTSSNAEVHFQLWDPCPVFGKRTWRLGTCDERNVAYGKMRKLCEKAPYSILRYCSVLSMAVCFIYFCWLLLEKAFSFFFCTCVSGERAGWQEWWCLFFRFNNCCLRLLCGGVLFVPRLGLRHAHIPFFVVFSAKWTIYAAAFELLTFFQRSYFRGKRYLYTLRIKVVSLQGRPVVYPKRWSKDRRL